MPFESDQIPKAFGRYYRSTSCSYCSLPGVKCSLHCGHDLMVRLLGLLGGLDEVRVIHERVTNKSNGVTADICFEIGAESFFFHHFKDRSADHCPEHGARTIALEAALHRNYPEWASISVCRSYCMLHVLQGGKHAHDSRFRKAQMLKAEGSHGM